MGSAVSESSSSVHLQKSTLVIDEKLKCVRELPKKDGTAECGRGHNGPPQDPGPLHTDHSSCSYSHTHDDTLISLFRFRQRITWAANKSNLLFDYHQHCTTR